MHKYTSKQRNLLRGLRSVADELWSLKDSDHLEVWQKGRMERLERVWRALVRDAKQEQDSFEGVMALVWASDVLAASVPTPTWIQRSQITKLDDRDYPSNLEADSKPTPSPEG